MMSCIYKKIVSTDKAPKPVAPYNQAVVADRTCYVSGVLGMDKNTNKIVEGGTLAEARQALDNLGIILEAADSCYAKVAKITVLLKDIQDFGAVNDLYKEYFTADFPARTAFQAGNLPLNANIEIEAIALTGEVKVIAPES